MTIESPHEFRKVMRSPRSVEIDITTKCNLRCSYCYHFGSAGDVEKDLPTVEWITFFRELGSLAVMGVTLAGGEPFIRDDILEIIQGIVDNRMRFSILSNGTLISDKVAEEIAATKRCDTVQISLDGANAATHDSCRGPNSFHRAIKGIQHLQQHGIPVRIRVTIHHRNVQELEEIVPFILDDLGIASLSTNSAGCFGLYKNYSRDIQMTIEDRCLAMHTLMKLSKEYPGRVTANAGPHTEVKMFQQIEQMIAYNEPANKTRGYLTSCNGIWQKIAVRADGIIVPCTLLPSIELGRINQDSLFDIWQNHPRLIAMRNRHNISLASFAFCKDCRYLDYCSGGCPAGAYNYFGTDFHPSPEGCYRQFLTDGGILP